MRNFETGATRDSDDGKLDYQGFLSPYALERFAKYMHKHRRQADGKMRASDNWKLGIPLESYQKSLFRHHIEFEKALASGDMAEAEELACAMMFNLQGWLHEMVKPKPAAEAVSNMRFGFIPGSDEEGGTKYYNSDKKGLL